ncbi:MAG: phenylalanine 4-monooxygenase [bacterium]
MNAMEQADIASPKNRYWNAVRAPDYTIDQDWASYTAQEHDRWDRLIASLEQILPGRACNEYLEALDKLKLSDGGIPDMEQLSDRLEPITGWRVVPVTDIVPDDIFFEHLANRRFPAGAFIRPEEEFEYLQEPDIFHDIFGHVPLLANPIYADFMQAYGQGGMRAIEFDCLANLSRLYWYTVEFGLIKSAQGLRIFGAGIMSSPGECVYATESETPARIEMDLMRIMQTEYIIDDYQKCYFVIESFQELLDLCQQDFAPFYRELKSLPNYKPTDILETDRLVLIK